MPDFKSYTIDKVAWHAQTPGNTETLEKIHKRFRALNTFLPENDLVDHVILGTDEPITDDVKIHTDSLNEKGSAIMKACYHKWLKKVDRGLNPEDVSVFTKALSDL